MLQHDPWVEALRKTALDNALREEVAAQMMSLVAWTKWIHEGPAAGLRRQHRFSRIADGWIPTAKSSGMLGPVDPMDEVDDDAGLSTEQVDQLRQHSLLDDAPAGAQQ